MSGTKIIASSAAAIVLLAAGTAVVQHRHAAKTDRQLAAAARENSALHARLAESEQRKSAAETRASEAEKDNTALLAAIAAARAKSATTAPDPSPAASARKPSPSDPLADTLDALFPDGIVAVLGDRKITVDEVRKQITPLLSRLRETTGDSTALRHRLYALQNSATAELVTQQLMIKQFHYQQQDELPRSISAETVDGVMTNRLRERFDNDQASLLVHLSAEGLTPTQYRQKIEEEIILQYMRAQQRKVAPGKK